MSKRPSSIFPMIGTLTVSFALAAMPFAPMQTAEERQLRLMAEEYRAQGPLMDRQRFERLMDKLEKLNNETQRNGYLTVMGLCHGGNGSVPGQGGMPGACAALPDRKKTDEEAENESGDAHRKKKRKFMR